MSGPRIFRKRPLVLAFVGLVLVVVYGCTIAQKNTGTAASAMWTGKLPPLRTGSVKWVTVDNHDGILPGDITAVFADGFGISQGFQVRYNRLIAIYGNKFGPPLQPNAGITRTEAGLKIDRTHLQYFRAMSEWQWQDQRRTAASP